MKKKVLLLLCSLFLIFSVPLIGYSANVIKLGCAISFTGKKSRTGKLYVDSYNLAAKLINEQGGIKVNGKSYKIKIVYYDD
jgi:branched-chain amino acid transport system substrate-binding protein